MSTSAATSETATRTVTPLSAPERGALWLDEMAPGWASQIILDTLNITDGGDCVCGQVFWDKRQWGEHDNDGWDYVKHLLGSDRAAEYGFHVAGSYCDPDHDAKYDALQAEWTRIIRERQAS